MNCWRELQDVKKRKQKKVIKKLLTEVDEMWNIKVCWFKRKYIVEDLRVFVKLIDV